MWISYALSLPVMAFAGGYLAFRAGGGRTARAVLAIFMLLPALNLWFGQLAVQLDGLRYMHPRIGMEAVLTGAAAAPRASGALLLGAAGAILVMSGRSGAIAAGAALGGGLGAWLGRRVLAAAGTLLAGGDTDGVASLATLAMGVGLVAVAGGLVGRARSGAVGRLGGLLALLSVVMSMVSATPPVLRLLYGLHWPSAAGPLPAARPGRVWAQPALDPRDIPGEMVAAGRVAHGPPIWRCMSEVMGPWGEAPRLSVSLGLTPDTPVAALRAYAAELTRYGVGELVLLGQAPMGPGPLGQAWSQPGAPMILDRAPVGTRWVRVSAEGWRFDDPNAPDTGGLCALLPEDDATVGVLYDAVRALTAPGGPCAAGVGAVLLWTPAEGGPALPDLSCPW
ncbi:MAG: hypothetical protein H6739_16345 [Alphaproteobacteria bacterium]|nr:hypothetical protein [Alphaproteobacteria bacterium]